VYRAPSDVQNVGNSIGLIALFDSPGSVNIHLIYVDANFPANLSKWALSAVVFAVSASRVEFHLSLFDRFGSRHALELISTLTKVTHPFNSVPRFPVPRFQRHVYFWYLFKKCS